MSVTLSNKIYVEVWQLVEGRQCHFVIFTLNCNFYYNRFDVSVLLPLRSVHLMFILLENKHTVYFVEAPKNN